MGGSLCVHSVGSSVFSRVCLDACVWVINPCESVQTRIYGGRRGAGTECVCKRMYFIPVS